MTQACRTGELTLDSILQEENHAIDSKDHAMLMVR